MAGEEACGDGEEGDGVRGHGFGVVELGEEGLDVGAGRFGDGEDGKRGFEGVGGRHFEVGDLDAGNLELFERS